MRRCLIVDDSPIIRRVARLILERLRFEVAEADSVQAALDACKSQMPDVILLDWHMPGTPPLELLTALRSLGGEAKPFIVYCTTENDPMDISKAMHAGCDDFMLKPFTLADLEAKVATLQTAA
jgi:two-component system chemotaxis response regulator CheY